MTDFRMWNTESLIVSDSDGIEDIRHVVGRGDQCSGFKIKHLNSLTPEASYYKMTNED